MEGVSPQQLLFAIVVFLNTLFALYVLWKGGRGIIGKAFFTFVIGSNIWMFALMLLFTTGSFAFDRYVHTGALIMMVGLVLFAKVLPRGKVPSLLFFILALFPAVVAAIFIPTGLIIETIVLDQDKHFIEPINGPLFIPYMIILVGYVVAAAIYFFTNYRASVTQDKRLMRYIFLGAGIYMLIIIVSNAILPAFNVFVFNMVGPLGSILLVGFTAYAIVKHQFLDIRVFIQRGVIYFILLAIIVSFYLAVIHTLGILIQINTNLAAVLSGGITTILGIFTVPVIDRYLRRATDHIFFKGRYVYAEALESLSTLMSTTLRLGELLENVGVELERILRTERVQFVLEDYDHARIQNLYPSTISATLPETNALISRTALEVLPYRDKNQKEVYERLQKIYEHEQIEVVVPVVNSKKCAGLILLGPKKSGGAYTETDLALLRTFRLQFGVALEKARLYQEVVEYSEQLEQKVEERTEEIATLQEQQKQMMLDISHQLQTPLTVMKGELQMLRKEFPDTAAIDVCEHSVDDVSKLINDLLRLSRLESVDTRSRRTSTSRIDRVVHEIGAYFDTIASADSNVSFTYSATDDVSVVIDTDDFTSIVSNILNNAILYTDPERPNAISLTLTKQERTAIVTISDTGLGIDTKDIEHIFERFYRSTEKQIRSKDGTGLGLAIAKKLIEHYGGTIEVRSKPGEGTAFTLAFQVEE